MEIIDYVLPNYWLGALIYDDWSGLEDKEVIEIKTWLESESKKYPRFWALCPSDDGDMGFCWENDANNLGGDCTRVLFDIGDQ